MSSTPTLRPLQRGETETVQAVFDGLSPRSRFLRFHTGVPRLGPSMLRRLTEVREREHAAHVAEVGGRPVGLVRWLRLPGEAAVADLAVEVVDAWHGVGVGRLLVEEAARSARAADIREFVADVSGENRPIRTWLTRLGLHADPADRDHFRIPLAALERSVRARPAGTSLDARGGQLTQVRHQVAV